MANVLVVFEDQYFKPLELAVRRTVLNRQPKFPIDQLHFDTVRGFGGFKRFVAVDWHKYQHGLPMRPTWRPAKAICIADGDKCAPFLVPSLPAADEKTDAWQAASSDEFTRKLTEWSGNLVTCARGVILRWNLESLLISCFDLASSAEVFSILGGFDWSSSIETRFAEFLTSCNPKDPRVEALAFADSYRSPTPCFTKMLRALGTRPLAKSDPARESLARLLTKAERLDVTLARVPDIRAIAQHIIDAASG